MINILIAEDHQIVRNGIKLLLATNPGLEIRAEVNNGQEVLDFLGENDSVDIVLADCSMPIMDGSEMLKHINLNHKNVKVIFLSMLDDLHFISGLMCNGASGYLLKNTDARELIFAIQLVYSGGRYISTHLSLKLLDELPKKPEPSTTMELPEFTSREMEILTHMAEGLTTVEISSKLFISKRTVEGHKQSLLYKTSSKNTAVLIKNAARWRLI